MKTYLIILCSLCIGSVQPGLCLPPSARDVLEARKLAMNNSFAGFLELPPRSFLYALEGVDDSTAQTFVHYGLNQIVRHPDRAKHYALMLKLFLFDHPLVTPRQPEETESAGYPYVYGSSYTSPNGKSLLELPAVHYPEKEGWQRWLPGIGFFEGLLSFFSIISSIVVIFCIGMYILIRKGGSTVSLVLDNDIQPKHEQFR